MKTKEINNGRLAMIAVTGFFFQLQVTGHIVRAQQVEDPALHAVV